MNILILGGDGYLGWPTAMYLAARGHDVAFALAMRYWDPNTDQALDELERAGVERLLALTMYPHYSMATTGSSVVASGAS